MPRTVACPDGSDLLALAAEGVAPPGVSRHVEVCPACRRRLRRLKAELVHLRSLSEAGGFPPPAGSALWAMPGEN